MVVNDKVYFYIIYDEQYIDGNDYCMYDYCFFISIDMINWYNKGMVFRYFEFDWVWGDEKIGNVYVYYVIYCKEVLGEFWYYFYVMVEGGQINDEFGFVIGVGVFDNLEGFFVDLCGMFMILFEDIVEYKDYSWCNIDLVVFIDDDGCVYFYWGNQQLWWVELELDLVYFKGESYILDVGGRM